MQRLSSLSSTDLPTYQAGPDVQDKTAVTYGYGLNLVLAARTGSLANNSKRMDRDFQVTNIACALSGSVTGAYAQGFSVILGTNLYDWFSDYVLAGTIFGDGALPHWIPGGGQFVEKGDSIVVQAKNVTSTLKTISLFFHGYFL